MNCIRHIAKADITTNNCCCVDAEVFGLGCVECRQRSEVNHEERVSTITSCRTSATGIGLNSVGDCRIELEVTTVCTSSESRLTCDYGISSAV